MGWGFCFSLLCLPRDDQRFPEWEHGDSGWGHGDSGREHDDVDMARRVHGDYHSFRGLFRAICVILYDFCILHKNKCV